MEDLQEILTWDSAAGRFVGSGTYPEEYWATPSNGY
jgi:hypothetical protein